jgi:3-oxoacyl-[acyl-carrier protein] reductase
MRLQGKSAIVTGGGSGFGAAMVALFAAEGARVVVADIDRAAAERVAAAAPVWSRCSSTSPATTTRGG